MHISMSTQASPMSPVHIHSLSNVFGLISSSDISSVEVVSVGKVVDLTRDEIMK